MISMVIPLLAGQCAIAFAGPAESYVDLWHAQEKDGGEFDVYGWLPEMSKNIEEFVHRLSTGESARLELVDGQIIWAAQTEPGACVDSAPVPKLKP